MRRTGNNRLARYAKEEYGKRQKESPDTSLKRRRLRYDAPWFWEEWTSHAPGAIVRTMAGGSVTAGSEPSITS